MVGDDEGKRDCGQNSFIMDAWSQGEKMQSRWKRDGVARPLGVQEGSLVEKVYGEIGRNEEQKRAQDFQGSAQSIVDWPGGDWLALGRAGR